MNRPGSGTDGVPTEEVPVARRPDRWWSSLSVAVFAIAALAVLMVMVQREAGSPTEGVIAVVFLVVAALVALMVLRRRGRAKG